MKNTPRSIVVPNDKIESAFCKVRLAPQKSKSSHPLSSRPRWLFNRPLSHMSRVHPSTVEPISTPIADDEYAQSEESGLRRFLKISSSKNSEEDSATSINFDNVFRNVVSRNDRKYKASDSLRLTNINID